MHVNAADNVLHLVVGLLAAAVGFFVADSGTTRANTDTMARP